MSAVVEIAAERLPAQAVEPAATPMRLMELAISKGAGMDQLERLMALQERWEANEARKAYVKAMAEFKSEPIIVVKDATVDFTSQKGRTHYKHASLAAVVDAVVSRMGKFGLSHKWETKQSEGAVSVTCVITHEMGHSESVTLAGPRDQSGNKNELQQIASSMTYLQRYTLMSLCGLASKDMVDDDAQAAGKTQAPTVPDGYDEWSADIQAVAEEGTARLQESWKKSAEAFRTYATKHDLKWWEGCKSKAAKVKP